MHADVVVVGAGMAGLTCALDLRDAGVSVIVLEAGDRPGGRVRTVVFGDGRWVETGGEWIDTAHTNVHDLLKRYGLETTGGAPPWWDREAGDIDDGNGLHPAREWLGRDDVRTDLARYDHLATVFAGGIADPAWPDAHPDAEQIDARSGEDLFDELELGERARFILTRAIEFEYTCEPSEISALFLAQQRSVELAEEAAHGEVRSQRVDGGLSQLALGIAEDLGDLVHFGRRLVGLDHGGDGVVARTVDGEVRAAHVVLALPLVPLRRVDVTPAFDGSLAAAIADVDLGAVTKTFVRYPGAIRSLEWIVSHRFLQRVYDAAQDQPRAASVLDAYIGGDDARRLDVTHPEEGARISHVAAEIERMLPALAGTSTGGASRSWTADPNFGGSFSMWRPGQVSAYWRILRRPHGRVHFAGEHTATVCGYVEGAVESGHRVAERLLRS
jgi:monoamine oxidase